MTARADTGDSASDPAGAAPVPPADNEGRITGLARWPGVAPAEAQEALLDGTLVAADGCLWVEPAPGSRYAVIWPAHVELDAAAEPARVIDRRSGQSARVGEPVRLGGGELPAASTASMQASLPAGCRGNLWLASGIIARSG